MIAKIIQLGLIIFFILPFAALIYYFHGQLTFDLSEIVSALINSVVQGFWVSLIAVVFGFFCSFYILSLSSQPRKLLQKICIIPSVLPSLFTILIAFTIIQPFPMGNVGVIIVLAFIYSGYILSLFSQAIADDVRAFLPIGLVYGLNRAQFYRVILIKHGRYLVFLALIVFISTLTAFTVPMIVSGGHSRNLEILIYEKMFTEFKWSAALGIGLIQQLVIGFSILQLSKHHSSQAQTIGITTETLSLKKYSSVVYGLAVLAYLFSYLGSYIYLLIRAVQSPFIHQVFNTELYTAISSSFFFFLTNTSVFFVIFICLLYLLWHLKSIVFLNFFTYMSTMLVAACLFFWGESDYVFLNYLKLSYIFNVLFFVSLYKLSLENKLQDLTNQKMLSKIYNISFSHFLFKILFPQLQNQFYYLLTYLSIMSLSEFAIIKISGSSIRTLGSVMASYLSSYRIEGAFVVSCIMIGLWFVSIAVYHLILSGGKFGFNKKS